jgi:hypothetical protein
LSLGVAGSPAAEETVLWNIVAAADARMFEAKRRKKAGREQHPAGAS